MKIKINKNRLALRKELESWENQLEFQEKNNSLDLEQQVENDISKLDRLLIAQNQDMIARAQKQAAYKMYKKQFGTLWDKG